MRRASDASALTGKGTGAGFAKLAPVKRLHSTVWDKVGELQYEKVDEWKDEATSVVQAKERRRLALAGEARAMFDRVDLDGSGILDRDEVAYVCQLMGENLGGVEIDQVMAEMDADSSGAVQYEEFELWWKRRGKNKLIKIADITEQTQATMALLGAMDIFSGIDNLNLRELALNSFEYAVRAHQVIVNQFDKSTESFFVVASGKFEATVEGRDTKHAYERGQYFGEKGLYVTGPQIRGATCYGTSKSTIVQIWLTDLCKTPVVLDRLRALEKISMSSGSQQDLKTMSTFLQVRMVRTTFRFAVRTCALSDNCMFLAEF